MAARPPSRRRLWLALRPAGLARSCTKELLSSQDPVVRRGRPEEPGIQRDQSRRRAPVLVDGDFALAESAAIVEHIEDRWLTRPFSLTTGASARDPGADGARGRSPSRRGRPSFARGAGSRETLKTLQRELALWDGAAARDCLTGQPSAVDLTVYPFIAPLPRVARRGADFGINDLIGPRLAAWSDRIQTLPHRSTDLTAALESYRSDFTR
jgi:glutathione S-transferase